MGTLDQVRMLAYGICSKLTLPSIVGVGAVFIATLALDRLPEASEPPVNATDFLILTIEPIVAFMIMCSILIRRFAHLQLALC